MNNTQIKQLEEEGYVILQSIIPNDLLIILRERIDICLEIHKSMQIQANMDNSLQGTALHALVNDSIFIKLIEHLEEVNIIQSINENFFKSKCIINSLSVLDNLPGTPNFSANIHRDLRFYSGNFPIMLNCLIMVDNFTMENGGTYLLPKSHLKEEKPTDKEFFDKAIQATGKSGDLLIFNANVWHASAPNKTQDRRRGIPITLSKSFMKQLLDYPRAIGYDKIDTFSESVQQLLGYHSRTPASLDEWYQPESTRMYRKNQD